MNCEKCGRPTPEREAVYTILGPWMRLCPACRDKWAKKNDGGEILYHEEKVDAATR